MIISRISSYLDIIVTARSVAFLVFRLISEIPVGHVDTSSWCEEFFHVVKHPHALFIRLEMVERSKEDDSIPGSVIAKNEAIQCFWYVLEWIASYLAMTRQGSHIADFKAILRIEFPSLFDHSRRTIYPEVSNLTMYNSSHITLEESSISTSDIEYTCIASATNI